MPSPDERVAALDQILELAVLVNADMAAGLAERGLTEARTHLVWVLRQQGPCTQRDLATALRVSPRNVTGLVDALVATGFVTRQPHPTDRRATLVQLTDHGATVAAALDADHQEFARLLFADMPGTTFAGFTDGLGAVLDRMRGLVAESRPRPEEEPADA
ncbi:MarR family winged helix-turn-helix transcriptional regulator [Nocardioides pakistanensis]